MLGCGWFLLFIAYRSRPFERMYATCLAALDHPP